MKKKPSLKSSAARASWVAPLNEHQKNDLKLLGPLPQGKKEALFEQIALLISKQKLITEDHDERPAQAIVIKEIKRIQKDIAGLRDFLNLCNTDLDDTFRANLEEKLILDCHLKSMRLYTAKLENDLSILDNALSLVRKEYRPTVGKPMDNTRKFTAVQLARVYKDITGRSPTSTLYGPFHELLKCVLKWSRIPLGDESLKPLILFAIKNI